MRESHPTTSTAVRVFITGIVVKRPHEQDPAEWSLETIAKRVINPDIAARSVDDHAWPEMPRKKRVYTCSICGGRHSKRHCPHNPDNV